MRNLLVMNLECGDRPEYIHQFWRVFLARTTTHPTNPVAECVRSLAQPVFYNRQEDVAGAVKRPNLLCEMWWDKDGQPRKKADGTRENVVAPRREEISTV